MFCDSRDETRTRCYIHLKLSCLSDRNGKLCCKLDGRTDHVFRATCSIITLLWFYYSGGTFVYVLFPVKRSRRVAGFSRGVIARLFIGSAASGACIRLKLRSSFEMVSNSRGTSGPHQSLERHCRSELVPSRHWPLFVPAECSLAYRFIEMSACPSQRHYEQIGPLIFLNMDFL